MAIKTKISAKTRYGILTASDPVVSLKNVNIRYPPKIGAIVVPSELNPCARLRRDDADFCGPSIATYGFAAICNNVNPSPITNNAARKKPYIWN